MMATQDEKIDVSSASFYALHVALQTLKERCQNLQQRLTGVEEENEVLRKTAGMDMPGEGNNEDYLRVMVGDLVRQKSQLTEHIAMVTKENRQLWSRLSKLTKENSTLGLSLSKIRDAINSSPTSTSQHSVSSASRNNNNLIRSKTFTRPNPKLRERLVESALVAAGSENNTEEENMSLEEISLQIINKLVEGKENFEQKCGEILDTTDSTDNLCFGFKGTTAGGGSAAVQATSAVEAAETIDKCTTETVVVKNALLQQQGQLKQLIQSLSERKKPICRDCVKRQSVETVSVKSVDSQTKTTEFLMNGGGIGGSDAAMDRTCPMCGKCYDKSEDFEVFQKHVEWHFIDDNELDLSFEKTYDLISHTNQNF